MSADFPNLCGFRLKFAESVYNLPIPLTIYDSIILLYTHIVFCSWIPLIFPDLALFIQNSENFVAESAKSLLFGATLSDSVLAIGSRKPKKKKDQRKIAILQVPLYENFGVRKINIDFKS